MGHDYDMKLEEIATKDIMFGCMGHFFVGNGQISNFNKKRRMSAFFQEKKLWKIMVIIMQNVLHQRQYVQK